MDTSFGAYVDYRTKGIDDGGLNTDHGSVEFMSALGTESYIVAQTKDKRSISFAVATDAKEVEDEIIKLDEELDKAEEDEEKTSIQTQITNKERELKRHESLMKRLFELNESLN